MTEECVSEAELTCTLEKAGLAGHSTQPNAHFPCVLWVFSFENVWV